MTPEGKVKEQVKKVLQMFDLVAAGSKREMQNEDAHCNGWYYMPMKGTSFGVNGIPDFVGVVRGQFFSIETKKPGGEMTANQEYRARGIQRGGGRFFLIDGDTCLLVDWLKEVTE